MERVMITGHTGFKGSWLSLLLLELGHKVSGMSLEPVSGGLFETEVLSRQLEHDFRVDIRDKGAVLEAMQIADPTMVFHFAAQPLVRESYREPKLTFETNVYGTINVLDAIASSKSITRAVIATTDKVYLNNNQNRPYCEDDPLGGLSPYSASKAMADIYSQEWAHRNPQIISAIVRAGNVIGGGDRSSERLIPDVIESLRTGREVRLRNPDSTRPWQHVLDCVYAYWSLIQHLGPSVSGKPWNVGPAKPSQLRVVDLAKKLMDAYGAHTPIVTSGEEGPLEDNLLAIDCEKITNQTGWRPVLTNEEMIRWTALSELPVHSSEFISPRRQVSEYLQIISDRDPKLLKSS
jgi:CDP-glucose 4,6-dehydratase